MLATAHEVYTSCNSFNNRCRCQFGTLNGHSVENGTQWNFTLQAAFSIQNEVSRSVWVVGGSFCIHSLHALAHTVHLRIRCISVLILNLYSYARLKWWPKIADTHNIGYVRGWSRSVVTRWRWQKPKAILGERIVQTTLRFERQTFTLKYAMQFYAIFSIHLLNEFLMAFLLKAEDVVAGREEQKALWPWELG